MGRSASVGGWVVGSSVVFMVVARVGSWWWVWAWLIFFFFVVSCGGGGGGCGCVWL